MNAFVPTKPNPADGQSLGGNPCLLVALDHAPTAIPDAHIIATQCQSWPIDQATIAVRCYANGRLIQCCGHGLLASAFFWQQRLHCNALNLQMNNSHIASWREGKLTWLSFNTLSTHRCQLPEWVAQVFPGQQAAIVAATAGDEQGYLVLQWPDGFSLSSLPKALAIVADYTQRALICTAAQPRQGKGAIELRYFAPQHGVIEDLATGSAMRVLSHFWSGRFQQLSAWQCSATGAELFANFKGQHVEIGGRCLEQHHD